MVSKRNTQLKSTLLKILEEKRSPLTVPHLMSLLEKKRLHPNKTTLYRQLENMKESGVVEEVLLEDGIAHFEFKREHHHHFICEICNQVSCLEDQVLEKAIHRFEKQISDRGASVSHHQFSVFGTCRECRVK